MQCGALPHDLRACIDTPFAGLEAGERGGGGGGQRRGASLADREGGEVEMEEEVR